MKYNIELNSDEGTLLANLLIEHIIELTKQKKLIPSEICFRDELYEKIHPANNQNKIQGKKE